SIDVTEDTLFKSDLKPFQALIDEKADQDFFILVSHLKYPQLDAKNAASQSHAIVTGLLRKKMGYNGLIITDDLEMGAIAKYGSYRDIGVKAVKAGVDIVMMCHEYPHETDVYLGLLEAYENGELDKAQIDASVRRIVKAKLRNGIPY
ncbi:MAG: glycoside hydrolase family 3 protein, partial [Selenomonas ruminantium]|nr:glycoside hydrolase family 3 protein [Selenomonas ruminantium]